MKKAYFLLALVCVSFFSCTKKNPDTSNQPKNYIVTGITDITLSQEAPIAVMYVNVQYLGPVQEHVSVSVSGLPPGVSLDTTTNLSGIPTFEGSLEFIDNNNAVSGNYPAKLVCNGSVTGQKSYNFNIRVLSCSSYLAGYYSRCSLPCTATGYYADNVTPDSASGIDFGNFGGMGVSIHADLFCGADTLNIPTQVVAGKTISGVGSFGAGYIYINYNVDSAGLSSSCSISMSR